MKRGLIYIVTIILIVLGCLLLMNNRDNESNSENQEKEVVIEDTVTTNVANINTTVSNGRDRVDYLTQVMRSGVGTKDVNAFGDLYLAD